MARYDEALQKTLKEEGGFVNNRQDPGGATNLGISLRFLQSAGKDTEDADGDGNKDELLGDLNNDGKVDIEDIRLIKVGFAGNVYKRFFWNPLILDTLNNTDVACQIFDISVNGGPGRARSLALDTAKIVNIKAVNLKELFASLNGATEDVNIGYNNALEQRREAFYKGLNKPTFLKGWLLRAARFIVKRQVLKNAA